MLKAQRLSLLVQAKLPCWCKHSCLVGSSKAALLLQAKLPCWYKHSCLDGACKAALLVQDRQSCLDGTSKAALCNAETRMFQPKAVELILLLLAVWILKSAWCSYLRSAHTCVVLMNLRGAHKPAWCSYLRGAHLPYSSLLTHFPSHRRAPPAQISTCGLLCVFVSVPSRRKQA